MVGTKITRQRIENQIESTKITRPRVGQCKNNSPKGRMGGAKITRQRMENQIVSTKITRPKVG